jgi:5-methylcytosine-specific restriction endonuclease McrA
MSTAAAVLYLDVDWRPLRIEPWQRAIADFFVGKCEVIEYSRDRTIQGVSREYPMPAVVRVLRRFKRDRIRIKFSRLNIYARDGFTCAYCRVRFPTEDLTFDHVIPRSRGGRTCWENIVSACIPCNSEKADRTPAEAGMTLIRTPRKPAYLPSVMVKMDSRQMPAEWAGYWTNALEG